VYTTLAPVPAPWTDRDIGSTPLIGAAYAQSGTFTSQGSGLGVLWSSTDNMHFVYQPWSGDGTIIAKVATLPGAGMAYQAGVMFRENLTSGARGVLVAIENNGGPKLGFRYRANANGPSTTSQVPAAAPYWLKLQRQGTTFKASTSLDGSAWTLVNQATVSMGAPAYVGLAVTSSATTMLAKASFTNVQLSPCHILTAAYGRPNAPEILALGAFQDRTVAHTAWHQAWRRWYDRHAPPVARFIKDKPVLRALVRAAFAPAVAYARWWLARKPLPDTRKDLSR
jgi:regulation of enolase protein 1 (concanavalin A-like superfamily)